MIINYIARRPFHSFSMLFPLLFHSYSSPFPIFLSFRMTTVHEKKTGISDEAIPVCSVLKGK